MCENKLMFATTVMLYMERYLGLEWIIVPSSKEIVQVVLAESKLPYHIVTSDEYNVVLRRSDEITSSRKDPSHQPASPELA